jgi:hypothetical protein
MEDRISRLTSFRARANRNGEQNSRDSKRLHESSYNLARPVDAVNACRRFERLGSVHLFK